MHEDWLLLELQLAYLSTVQWCQKHEKKFMGTIFSLGCEDCVRDFLKEITKDD